MTDGWGIQAQPQAGGGAEPVAVLLAGPTEGVNLLYQALLGDARFRVVALATDVEDLRVKLTWPADALVVDGTLFRGPQDLAAAVAPFDGPIVVLLPPVEPSLLDAVRGIRNVVEVATGAPNVPALLAKLYEAVASRRRAAGAAPSTAFRDMRGPSTATTGWRAVAVWGRQGGAGKSTLAANLALEAATRGLPTLLVGLGVPDATPLLLSREMRAQPNIATWAASPTPENLKACVQRYDALDVLAGFPDSVALGGYMPRAFQGEASLPALAGAAAYAGYAVVVFDVSNPLLEAAALAASNTLLLVAEPTPAGILAVSDALRLVKDHMAGKHRIDPAAVFLVVNRARETALRPQEFHRDLAVERPDAPPVLAVIPEDPDIARAALQFRPALHTSEALRRAVREIGDAILVAAAGRAQGSQAARPGRTINLGVVRIRL